MPRLHPGTRPGPPPRYDRRAIHRGVVHIGVGAFHRAHQAPVFEAALNGGDARWGITGVSLRSPAVRDSLHPQDGLYTLVEAGGPRCDPRVIGALTRLLVAPEQPAAVVAALADPATHLVTLTVTEKGYQPGQGNAADFLARGLAARRAAGLAPFTAISCDNLPGNGGRLAAAVLAQVSDPALADWIVRRGAFPETMVDRIVPATTPRDVAAVAHALGVEDQATVRTEPFWQWVIQDRFAGERPDFPALGVHLTSDVRPWEQAKLRLLNGAHSAIAYIGGLAGIAFVHEFVADAARRRFIETLWHESASTLRLSAGFDLDGYCRALMARFANPSLPHRTAQIAIDGSQKLPQRLLAPLRHRAAAGQRSPALARAVAAWIRCVEVGTLLDDPLAAQLRRAAALGDAADRVRAMLALIDPLPLPPSAEAEIVDALAPPPTGSRQVTLEII
ncbi:mannitol dehydrogenase family protein [Sandaracinobacteroides saxicola]|uniref:mannitol dehydrogenase family protein n=1 Tax=Sandaracinobacteroides saxicola TaxID=2759707 RepID=UPI0037DA6139